MRDDKTTSFTDFDKLVKCGSLPEDKLLLLVRLQAQALELVRLNACLAKDGFLRPAIMNTLDELREDEKSLMSAR